ncbi:hypothetical protein RRG08_000682 [Elysia crispata]|uniref:DUF6451 domain-containing protein n=1 Tax=Elysia crispata TaxID=231223 RepID=A0AAE1ATH0_9GAST|nr:hypothetical protein RRG08_000682 [Elysia crispata]
MRDLLVRSRVTTENRLGTCACYRPRCKTCRFVSQSCQDVAVGASKLVPQHFCSPGHQGTSDTEVLGLRLWRGDARSRFNLEQRRIFEMLWWTDKKGGTDADVRVRIGKARAAFKQLKNVWKASKLTKNTKLRLFNTTVKPVLLYGAETWRTTLSTMNRLQTFTNGCLRIILKIKWPEKISCGSKQGKCQ